MDNPPKIVAVTETKIKKKENIAFSPIIMGYNFLHSDSVTNAGGVGVYIQYTVSYRLRTDITITHYILLKVFGSRLLHTKSNTYLVLFVDTLTIT